MKLSQLIKFAEKLKRKHGDLDIVCVSYNEDVNGAILNDLRLATEEDENLEWNMPAGKFAALDIGC